MQALQIFSLGELFERVQTEHIFPDSKTFPDCTPKSALSSIKKSYEIQKNSKGFNLSAFISDHFTLPQNNYTLYKSVPGTPITEHIDKIWDVLTRKPKKLKDSLIPLPYPHVVPGGRFREIYYWDSYFTMLGLQVSKRIDLIQNMTDNFSYLIDHIGYIPNGNRRYYIGRSQPPFYVCMVQLLSEEKGKNVLVNYLPQLEKEYDFWMKGNNKLTGSELSVQRVSILPDGSLLNHYWDESDTPRPESFNEDIIAVNRINNKKIMYRNLRAAAESGWDFSSRWFKNVKDFSSIHTTEIIPVDLNCLLLYLEQTIAEAYQINGDMSTSKKFVSLANKRKRSINTYCWNEEKGFYFDYDYVERKQKKSLTLAAAFPLFFGIASVKQAASVIAVLKEKFLSIGGLVTTTETTDQQWDSPNGWAPLQWIAIQGIAKYGYIPFANDIATRWMKINKKVYENTGKMMEKYNVVSTNIAAGGGEYPLQDGFGWTNGVYLALDKWIKKRQHQHV